MHNYRSWHGHGLPRNSRDTQWNMLMTAHCLGNPWRFMTLPWCTVKVHDNAMASNEGSRHCHGIPCGMTRPCRPRHGKGNDMAMPWQQHENSKTVYIVYLIMPVSSFRIPRQLPWRLHSRSVLPWRFAMTMPRQMPCRCYGLWRCALIHGIAMSYHDTTWQWHDVPWESQTM